MNEQFGCHLSDPAIVRLTAQPSMLRGRTVTGMPPVWPAKDPADRVSVSVDFGGLIRQPIVQFDYVATGVAVQSCRLASTVVTYLVWGGAPGQRASIATTVTQADGQQITRMVLLPITSQGAVVLASDPTLFVINGRALSVGGVPIRLLPTSGPVTVAGQPFAVAGTPIAVGGP